MTHELPRLVGLGGLKRSGKDTLAEHWAEKYGYVVMGMSDPLLEMALVLNPTIQFDEPRRNLLGGTVYTSRPLSEIVANEGYVKAKEYSGVRSFLQRLGTDVGREMIDQDLWVKQARKTIEQHWSAGKNVAITGIRFPNEVAMVNDLGGSLLWISRPQPEDIVDAHASESSVSKDDFHWALENASTLERLYDVGDFLLLRMGGNTDVEYPGATQEARALLDQHGYVVAKINDSHVALYDGSSYKAENAAEMSILREMQRMSAEQPASHNGRVLTNQQKRIVEKGKREGREITITDTSVSLGDFTEEKQAEQDRQLGLLEIIGWTGEVRSDGKVQALHPIDWMQRTDYPKGYTALTKDPHRPLECMRCGARHVNHLQHTRWHQYLDEAITTATAQSQAE